MEEVNELMSITEEFDSARLSRSFFGTLCQIAGSAGIVGSIILGINNYEYRDVLIPVSSGIAASSLLGSLGTIANQLKKQSKLMEFRVNHTFDKNKN
tara:strand:+ start:173 stop:463 length:291 start_codon:yes stop_codon:yes gene_type:complete